MERQRQWPIMEQYQVWLHHLVLHVCFITETQRCVKRKISTATSEEIDDKGKVNLQGMGVFLDLTVRTWSDQCCLQMMQDHRPHQDNQLVLPP